MNPERLYYKCDDCNTFRWCVGIIDHNSIVRQVEEDEASNVNLKEEMKLLKKRIKQQQKRMQGAIKIGVFMFVLLIFVMNK